MFTFNKPETDLDKNLHTGLPNVLITKKDISLRTVYKRHNIDMADPDRTNKLNKVSALKWFYKIARNDRNWKNVLIAQIQNSITIKVPNEYPDIQKRYIHELSTRDEYKNNTDVLEYVNKHKLDKKYENEKSDTNNLLKKYPELVLIENYYVFIDGPATEQSKPELPEHVRDLDIQTLWNIAHVIDLNKKKSQIFLDNIPHVELPKVINKWSNNYINVNVNICPKTLRPYSYDREDGIPWINKVHKLYNNSSYMSTHNNFIKFVHKYKKYPTTDEFLIYLSKKYQVLPIYILKDIEAVFKDYDKVLINGNKKLSVDKFIKITTLSMFNSVRKFELEYVEIINENKNLRHDLNELKTIVNKYSF